MHSLELFDFIGVESCVDMKPDFSDLPPCVGPKAGSRLRLPLAGLSEKEYPPPMKLPATVMRKHHAGGGRLVIVEEKVERHGQFQAHRANGRLILNLLSPAAEINGADEEEEDGVGVDDPTVVERSPPAARECCQLSGENGVNNPLGGVVVPGAGLPVHT